MDTSAAARAPDATGRVTCVRPASGAAAVAPVSSLATRTPAQTLGNMKLTKISHERLLK